MNLQQLLYALEACYHDCDIKKYPPTQCLNPNCPIPFFRSGCEAQLAGVEGLTMAISLPQLDVVFAAIIGKRCFTCKKILPYSELMYDRWNEYYVCKKCAIEWE